MNKRASFRRAVEKASNEERGKPSEGPIASLATVSATLSMPLLRSISFGSVNGRDARMSCL